MWTHTYTHSPFTLLVLLAIQREDNPIDCQQLAVLKAWVCLTAMDLECGSQQHWEMLRNVNWQVLPNYSLDHEHQERQSKLGPALPNLLGFLRKLLGTSHCPGATSYN